MNRLVVNVGKLLAWARDPRYSWMTSLGPLRRAYAESAVFMSGQQCCSGGNPPTYVLPDQVVRDVVGSPGLAADLRRLKTEQKYQGIYFSAYGTVIEV